MTSFDVLNVVRMSFEDYGGLTRHGLTCTTPGVADIRLA
jgi:hypothetical protein